MFWFKKYKIQIILFIIAIICGNNVFADINLGNLLSGRILLQVENNGEAWYVNPFNFDKYYLKRPIDAFILMQKLGIGITNSDLEKLPIGILNTGIDSDNDGLSDALENAIGSNPQETDSDNDGYSDKNEIMNNFDPLSKKAFNVDKKFTEKNLGKIFIQTQKHGEAWYLDPVSKKRYYLSGPADALLIMRQFGLGITNSNLEKIKTNAFETSTNSTESNTENNCANCKLNNADSVIAGAADAIRKNDKEKAKVFFIPEMKKAIEYTMDFLDADGRLTLGNILSGSILSDSTDTKKTYSNEVYFSLGGYKVPLKFYVEKQADGKWLLTNL